MPVTAYETTTRKHLHAVVKQVDRQKRQIEFIASHEQVDREGELVLISGMDRSEYLLNPILLLEHARGMRFGRTDSLTQTIPASNGGSQVMRTWLLTSDRRSRRATSIRGSPVPGLSDLPRRPSPRN